MKSLKLFIGTFFESSMAETRRAGKALTFLLSSHGKQSSPSVYRGPASRARSLQQRPQRTPEVCRHWRPELRVHGCAAHSGGDLNSSASSSQPARVLPHWFHALPAPLLPHPRILPCRLGGNEFEGCFEKTNQQRRTC